MPHSERTLRYFPHFAATSIMVTRASSSRNVETLHWPQSIVIMVNSMLNNTIKRSALTIVMATQLVIGSAYATHELVSKDNAPSKSTAPKIPSDGHISWHEFRHDLVSYSRVSAMIDHHGVITLSGNVSSSTELMAIEKLASTVRGATDIKNRIKDK